MIFILICTIVMHTHHAQPQWTGNEGQLNFANISAYKNIIKMSANGICIVYSFLIREIIGEVVSL